MDGIDALVYKEPLLSFASPLCSLPREDTKRRAHLCTRRGLSSELDDAGPLVSYSQPSEQSEVNFCFL